MSIGTAFYPRAAPLNRKMQWREWSGYFAASAYADSPDIEYNAIREAAALIDVSPLYKYQVSGPDATRLVDRVITRDATKLAVGQVYYTSWCDEDGKVVDDGTVARLDDSSYRWTAADPSLRWFRMNARGLDVDDRGHDRAGRRARAPGPAEPRVLEAATDEAFADLKYFGRRGRAGRGHHRRRLPDGIHRRPRLRAVGGDEHAVELWDAFVAAGQRVRHPACRDAGARRRRGSRPG